LRSVRIFLLTGFCVALVDWMPCDCRGGQQGQDEKGEDLNCETHVEIAAAGKICARWERMPGKSRTEMIRCFTRIWLLLGS